MQETPNPARPQAKRGRRWFIGLCLVLFLVLLSGPFFVLRDTPARRKRARAARDVIVVIASLKLYWSEYGTFPTGEQPAIMDSLSGRNRNRSVFIEVDPRQISSQGYYLDPWGHPYRFDLSRPDDAHVSSAGPNGKEEPDDPRSDDIRSW